MTLHIHGLSRRPTRSSCCNCGLRPSAKMAHSLSDAILGPSPGSRSEGNCPCSLACRRSRDIPRPASCPRREPPTHALARIATKLFLWIPPIRPWALMERFLSGATAGQALGLPSVGSCLYIPFALSNKGNCDPGCFYDESRFPIHAPYRISTRLFYWSRRSRPSA